MISGAKEYPQVVHAIVATLATNHNLVLDEDGLINGVDIGIEVKEEWGKDSWRQNGQIQVRVGTRYRYSEMFRNVGFRQKADGTFNYDKIAAKIADYYEQALRYDRIRESIDNSKEASRLFIEGLETDLNVYDAKVDYSDQTGNLMFKVTGLKPHQARKFAELADELGLLTKRS